MPEEEEFQLHTMRSTRPIEWVGLTIVKAWLRATYHQIKIEDVHGNPDWFSKGVDLILTYPDRTETVDLKTDSYYGLDRKKKIKGFYHPDSGFLLLETTSQLRYDRKDLGAHPDVEGWLTTGQATHVFYYYLAVLTPPVEVLAMYDRMVSLEKVGKASELIGRELLAKIDIERDELLSYSLPRMREWYKTAPTEAFKGWSAATNAPYVTVSKRLKREYFLQHGLGTSHGSIVEVAKRNLSLNVGESGPPKV